MLVKLQNLLLWREKGLGFILCAVLRIESDFSLFSRILPDLRTVVYPAAIATGGLEEWEYLWGWYTNTTDPYEKRICLNALAESTEPWILSRLVK